MYFLKKFRLRWFVNVVYMGTSGERDMTFSFLRLRSLQSYQLTTSGRSGRAPWVDLHFYRDLEQYLTHLEHQILC